MAELWKSTFHRVFLHELGHFVAQTLNKRYGGYGSGAFSIYYHKHLNDHTGGVTPYKPPEIENAFPPLERVPQNIFSKIHGILFEAYFSAQETSESLNNINLCIQQHGEDDFETRYKILKGCNGIGCDLPLEESFRTYLKKLKEESLLDDLLLLNPTDFILRQNDIYTEIDIDCLELNIQDFLHAYLPFYDTELNRMKQILNL